MLIVRRVFAYPGEQSLQKVQKEMKPIQIDNDSQSLSLVSGEFHPGDILYERGI